MTTAALPSPRSRRSGGRVLVATAAALLLVAGLAWLVLKPRTPAPAPGRWVAAGEQTFSDTVTATGTVRLRTGASVRVGAQISGLVRQLNVTIGSKVRRGDVIAEIDARAARARAAQARAQFLRAQVAAAKARADQARGAQLFAAGGLSGQQLDDLNGASALADASLDAARKDLAAASVDLDYVTIRAPIDGVVASVSTQQGETVASTFSAPTFVTIIQPANLEVVAMVDEADIGAVKIGRAADFTTETYPDRNFRGVVERIAPDATLVSGVVNYEVTLRIADDVARLKPQMTVNATLVAAERRAVTVPAAAIRRGPEGAFVLVQDHGVATRRSVTAGAAHGRDVEIARGLAKGEAVLVAGGSQP
jgi:HlyD family secretion protein